MTNKEFYDTVYNQSNKETKLLLKAWLYEMNYADKQIDFTTYTAFYQITNVIELIKGYCIDVSDIGTQDDAIKLLLSYAKRGGEL